MSASGGLCPSDPLTIIAYAGADMLTLAMYASLNFEMYVYMDVKCIVCVYVYVYMYMYTYVYVYICICVHMYMCTFPNVCVHVFPNVCMCICKYNFVKKSDSEIRKCRQLQGGFVDLPDP